MSESFGPRDVMYQNLHRDLKAANDRITTLEAALARERGLRLIAEKALIRFLPNRDDWLEESPTA